MLSKRLQAADSAVTPLLIQLKKKRRNKVRR